MTRTSTFICLSVLGGSLKNRTVMAEAHDREAKAEAGYNNIALHLSHALKHVAKADR